MTVLRPSCHISFAATAYCTLLLALGSTRSVEGAHTIEELHTKDRVFRINVSSIVDGQLETSVGEGKAVAHDLDVDAVHNYLERRLPGAGRNAAALRSLRQYEEANATIQVDEQATSTRLRDERRLIVAHGQREGVTLYSPKGPITYYELELLRIPGDSLTALALLPHKKVEVGEKWETDSWVIQMLTATEAVLKSELSCQLASVDAGVANVTFQGSIEGATAGASTNIEVSGRCLFDLEGGYWKRFELTQTEKRSVGAVTPGLDVTAKVVAQRSPAAYQGPLIDDFAENIPLEPDESVMLLSFDSPWNIRFFHDRNWHVFHRSERVAILRLLDKGSLIAQCNVSKIPLAGPGKHTSEEQFQRDIEAALGDKLKSIDKAEQIKTDDGRFLYRVTASGEANGLPMQWIYYLCADPSGRQVAFVFAVEKKVIDRLSNRDLGIVNSLQFREPIKPVDARE